MASLHLVSFWGGVSPLPSLSVGFLLPSFTHPGLAATDGSRPDGSCFLVPAKDLGDTAVGDPQLARDDTGPDAMVRHLDNLMTDVVGQGPPIDEDASKLVDSPLAQRG